MYKNKKGIVIKIIAVLAVAAILCISLLSCGKNVSIPVGNSINYGYTLLDGNDLYYSKVVENGIDYFSCIYKYNLKTKEDTLISAAEADELNSMNSFITLDNGNLYFLPNYFHESYLEAAPNISYINPKGSEPDAISTLFESDDVSCRYMQIIGGVIYYYDDIEEVIYRMNTNGTGRKVLCEAVISSYSIMCVANNRIYYGEDEFIYEVNVKGGAPRVIFDTSVEYEDEYFDIGYLTVDGKYIYYMDDDKFFINRVATDGSENKQIYEAPDGSYIESFNVADGVVYFVLNTAETYEIMAITPGSSNIRTVVGEKNGYADILPISIWGDTIYFLALPAYETIMDSDYVWFSVKRTGGTITPLRPFSIYSEPFGVENWDDTWQEGDVWDDDDGWEENEWEEVEAEGDTPEEDLTE